MTTVVVADAMVGAHWGDLAILAVVVLVVVAIVAIVRKVRRGAQ